MANDASASIIHDSYVNVISANQLFTMAGSVSTSRETKIKQKLPNLNVMAHISAPFHEQLKNVITS